MKKYLISISLFFIGSIVRAQMLVTPPINCNNQIPPYGNCTIGFQWQSDSCTVNSFNAPQPSTCAWSQTFGFTPTTAGLISVVSIATNTLQSYLTNYGLQASSYTAATQSYITSVCAGKFCQ